MLAQTTMQLRIPKLGKVMALAVSLAFAGCSAVGEPIKDLANEINATLSEVRRVTEVGDTVNVVFPYRSDWNHQSRIRDDGYATFTLIGELRVVGLSIAELNERLHEQYRKQRQSDEIELTADILDNASSGTDYSNVVFIIGDVTRPGPVELTSRPLTLFEAIGAAGGHLKRTANLANTMLVRRVRGTNELRSWSLDASIERWGESPAVFLQARDIVFVPNTAVDDVNIWIDQYIRQMIPIPNIIPQGSFFGSTAGTGF